MVVTLLVGTALGFLAGLGVGGGSLLILWLTVIEEMPHAMARGINLLFFLPAAVLSLFLRRRQGGVSLKKLWPGILSGCLAAALSTFLSVSWEPDLLKKFFGLLLIVIGLRELFYRAPKS